MRALTGELLLKAWDEGTGKSALARGVILLSLALPESNRQQIAQWPIAACNQLLLRLRELSFGPVLRSFGVCSKCSTRLEFEVPARELIRQVEKQFCEHPAAWTEGGKRYELRPVTTADLLATLDADTAEQAQERLLKSCLSISIEAAETEASAEPGKDSSASLRAPAVLEKFNQLNAAAELSCAIVCAACSSNQTLDLDIAQFLWLEVRSAAKRLLGEIHELAWAYGWSERSLLRMSPARRHAYLEMLSG